MCGVLDTHKQNVDERLSEILLVILLTNFQNSSQNFN